MKYVRYVCLIALALVLINTLHIAALHARAQEQIRQHGVSVDLVPTKTATPMPAADNADAWVITVTRDGSIYFGADNLSPEALLDKMKGTPRTRAAKLYVKADAGAPFGSVRQVLHSSRANFFDEVELLTRRAEQSGAFAAPAGMDLWIGDETASNRVTAKLLSQDGSSVKINNEDLPASQLQAKLAQIFDNRADRIVVLRVGSQVPFAQFVAAIDACYAAGASRVATEVATEI